MEKGHRQGKSRPKKRPLQMLSRGRPLQGRGHAGLGAHIGAAGDHVLFPGLPRPIQGVVGLAGNSDWLAMTR